MNQSLIKQLAFKSKDNILTLEEIYNHFGNKYYANGRFHLCKMMSRMVNNGTFKRIKKGVYQLNLIIHSNTKELF